MWFQPSMDPDGMFVAEHFPTAQFGLDGPLWQALHQAWRRQRRLRSKFADVRAFGKPSWRYVKMMIHCGGPTFQSNLCNWKLIHIVDISWYTLTFISGGFCFRNYTLTVIYRSTGKVEPGRSGESPWSRWSPVATPTSKVRNDYHWSANQDNLCRCDWFKTPFHYTWFFDISMIYIRGLSPSGEQIEYTSVVTSHYALNSIKIISDPMNSHEFTQNL